ncbi:CGNR zinc finger domain-containing protein [Dactylosporangium sp. NPDC000555]|uniref:CGNR zinc finger domain-containing protein n=1 Tax=Dactylosporangium sp. NPDC000555 TaxID=3154260 RepID=UPI003328A858
MTIPLAGEPLALDLVNTLANGPDGEVLDLLTSPKTAATWLDAQHALGRLTDARAGDLDLVALRQLRSHIAECVERVRQGAAPPPQALAALNAALHAAPAYLRMSWSGTAVTITVARSGDPRHDLCAELAHAAAELLSDPAITRVRTCEGARCRLLFLPAHPKRRWCSPSACGNRARVARHYQKHRS